MKYISTRNSTEEKTDYSKTQTESSEPDLAFMFGNRASHPSCQTAPPAPRIHLRRLGSSASTSPSRWEY